MEKNQKVWLDGGIVDFDDAKVPILTHSLQYGTGIFEGIRAYDTDTGPAIFRLRDHVRRFIRTAKIYSMPIQYSESEISNAIVTTVNENGLSSCYIRPFAFYNDQSIGLSTKDKKVSLYIAAVPFGSLFGENVKKGVRCKVSSWHRINSEILPVEAKASGNYLNSIIANNEARNAGYDEAILMSHHGYIAEGPGENIFLVERGVLVTPNRASDILVGITRDSIMKIANAMGFGVEERFVHRDELYTADEIFFAGTAAEVTPIINVDGIPVGNGEPGELTRKISEAYSNVVGGKDPAFSLWLTYVKS